MISEKVKECIEKCVNIRKTIDENTNLSIYGIDSLLRVQLVISLEEKFNIVFSDNDLTQNNFNTVNDICCLLKRYDIE